VFFRVHVKQYADEHGIRGYVRNLSDATVEVVAIGTPKKIGAFLEFCKEGSPSSNVDDVKVSELAEDESYPRGDFRILH